MSYFITPTGDIIDVAEDETAQADAVTQGMRAATDADIEKHNRKVELGGFADQAKAQVEALGRSVTALPGMAVSGLSKLPGVGFGASMGFENPEIEAEPIFKGFGTDEEIRQRDIARKEQHPILSTAVDIAPEVGLGIATGGAGLGVAGTATAIAGEAAVIGASKEGVDSFLQDRKFSGELALANVAQEAILGGVAGAAFKLAGKAVGGTLKGAKGASEAIQAGGMREYTENLLAKAKGAATGRGQALPGADFGAKGGSVGAASADDIAFRDLAEDSIRLINDPKYRESVLELAAEGDDIVRVAGSNAADSFDALYKNTPEAISVARKSEDIQRHAVEWTEDMLARQEDLVLDVVKAEGDQVRAALQDLVASGRGRFGSKATNVLEDMRIAQKRAFEAPVGAGRMLAIEQYKRTAAKAVKRLGKTAQRGDTEAQGKWIDVIEPHQEKMRLALENEANFGKAAVEQREMNAGLSEMIEALDRINKSVSERLASHYGKVGMEAINRRADVEDIVRLMSKDPDFIGNSVKDLDAALNGIHNAAAARQAHGYGQDQQLVAIQKAVTDLAGDFNLAQVVSIAKKRAPELSKQKGAASILVDELEGQSGIIGAAMKARKVAKEHLSGSNLGGDNPFGQLLGENFARYSKNTGRVADPSWSGSRSSFTRGLLERRGMSAPEAPPPISPLTGGTPPVAPTAPAGPGAPGGVGVGAKVGVAGLAGAGVLGMSDLAKAASVDQDQMATVGALQEITQAGDVTIDRTASNIASGQGAPTAQFSGLLKQSRESGNSLVVERFVGDSSKTPTEVYRERSDMVAQMKADPEQALERMSGWGNLSQLQPEAYEAISVQTAKLVGYLGNVLPQPSGRSLTNPMGNDPDEETIRDVAAKWQGAVEPMTVLEDLENGVASEVAIESLKTNWQGIYNRLQISAVAEYQSLIEADERPPEWVIEQMSNSLELGDMMGFMYSSKAGALMQSVTPPDQEQPAQQGKNIELKSSDNLAPSNALGRRK